MRDPCQPNPCRNGGACESRALEFTCFCLGWQGLLCDQSLTDASFEEDSSQSLSFSNETENNEIHEMNSVVIYAAAGGGGLVLLAAAGVGAYFLKKVTFLKQPNLLKILEKNIIQKLGAACQHTSKKNSN